QAVPTISAACGSVASLGVGAILAASNPPTRIIMDPADMTKDWHNARIQTLCGSRCRIDELKAETQPQPNEVCKPREIEPTVRITNSRGRARDPTGSGVGEG